ncbi:hypothetical protein BVRB_3g060810 [Beta vulgaris subsp. vulgaris]|nr:hypothetical protein BVRB_3g060810 [Beta vulgaris subsp. vulgaris]
MSRPVQSSPVQSSPVIKDQTYMTRGRERHCTQAREGLSLGC